MVFGGHQPKTDETRPPRLLIVWSPARRSRAATPSLRDFASLTLDRLTADQDWLVSGEAKDFGRRQFRHVH
jgi:hypothetical protein